jgi:hypothetical protein
MACEAGQSAVTVAKTSRTVQIGRLMPHIPGIAPVHAVIQIASLAVARAAERVDLKRCHEAGILDLFRSVRFGVIAAGTMARFAPDAQFAGLHLKVSG